MAARIATMATVIINSIKVNPAACFKAKDCRPVLFTDSTFRLTGAGGGETQLFMIVVGCS
ncbi:hypothetical protein D9M68_807020 [compost metagenome]